jgi:hypothetical protein
VTAPQPTGTPAELAAVRRALDLWQVNTVVIAPSPPGSSFLVQGHDPTYAAAFMTAALGRPPHISAGAWVWDGSHGSHGSLDSQAPLTVAPGQIDACVRLDEKAVAPSHATLRVARCMLTSSATSATSAGGVAS